MPHDAQQENSIHAALSAIESSHSHEDPNYPRFHVAPPAGRLNDPNGLVYKDGTYHVFHQLGPFFPERKRVYWGHCSSRDLTHWQTHAPALAPNAWYDTNGVYSGGATVAGDEVWFHYTGNVKKEDGSRGSYQCAAKTADFETFTKLEANPLISGPPPGYTAHVRDPFVTGTPGDYKMYLGAQREDMTGTILAYRSADLINWDLVGEVDVKDPKYRDFGYMWECPNVLEVKDQDTGEAFDVLLFSPQGIRQEESQFRNIFACGYVIGHLDGNSFVPVSDFIELDSGFEFYAPQVFTLPDDVDRPPLLMGWAGNATEDDQPSLRDFGWVHTLTVARELRLKGGRLYQAPLFLDEEGKPSSTSKRLALASLDVGEDGAEIEELRDQRSFVLQLVVGRSTPWELLLGKTDGPHVTFRFDSDTFTVDRSTSLYPHGDRRTVPLPSRSEVGDTLEIILVHDRSVTEVFVGGGHTAFTMRSYLDADSFQVRIGGNVSIEEASATLV